MAYRIEQVVAKIGLQSEAHRTRVLSQRRRDLRLDAPHSAIKATPQSPEGEQSFTAVRRWSRGFGSVPIKIYEAPCSPEAWNRSLTCRLCTRRGAHEACSCDGSKAFCARSLRSRALLDARAPHRLLELLRQGPAQLSRPLGQLLGRASRRRPGRSAAPIRSPNSLRRPPTAGPSFFLI